MYSKFSSNYLVMSNSTYKSTGRGVVGNIRSAASPKKNPSPTTSSKSKRLSSETVGQEFEKALTEGGTKKFTLTPVELREVGSDAIEECKATGLRRMIQIIRDSWA